MSLQFEPAGHVYTWQGRRVPSVTQILKPFYTFLDRAKEEHVERKRQIGVAVDYAIQLDIAGTLDPLSLHPSCDPYFTAWRRFRREVPFRVHACQRQLYHPLWQIAGTPDIEGELRAEGAVVDVKCVATYCAVWELQTAAYRELINQNAPAAEVKRRFSLRLLASGEYRFDEHRDAFDGMRFQAALSLARWIIERKLDYNPAVHYQEEHA